MNIRAGPQSDEICLGVMNHVFFSISWMHGCVCVTYLWRQCDALTNGKPLTCTTYLSIFTDLVHLLMEKIFPDGCGLFQQDNVPCHTEHEGDQRNIKQVIIMLHLFTVLAAYFKQNLANILSL